MAIINSSSTSRFSIRRSTNSRFTSQSLRCLFIFFPIILYSLFCIKTLRPSDFVPPQQEIEAVHSSKLQVPTTDSVPPKQEIEAAHSSKLKVPTTDSGSPKQEIEAAHSSKLEARSSDKAFTDEENSVLGLATHVGLQPLKRFVGSLRATGYLGNIILGVEPDLGEEVSKYLHEQNVTIKTVEVTKNCTYTGYEVHDGGKYDQKCSKEYPDYKITWGRFALYRDWLKDCPSCTGGVMLTDIRDAFFQRNPFDGKYKISSLMLFEEHPDLTAENWLTSIPASLCRNFTYHGQKMICSGSTMGLREGILDYLDVMLKEFDYWKDRVECRLNMIGDDQSIHDYLYYTNQFRNATAIPHATGPIHVIGYQGALIFRKAEEDAKKANVSFWNYYVKDEENWQNWLPEEHNLIDPKTGLVVNTDGYPSPQVHQYDRLDPLIQNWINKMVELGWPHNKPKGMN